MIVVTSQAIKVFHEWNLDQVDAGYLIFQIINEEIVLTKMGPKGAPWEALAHEFQTDESAYATYHFHHHNKNGEERCKTILVRWAPMTATVQQRMQYSMHSKTIRAALTGVGFVIQACDAGDLERDVILEKLLRNVSD
eukprot:TRINITY_DN10865_c0_g1_i1.p1 TRINITY_DN10865_c0_g1~~TRINITY_DN10865_c0_g1_i1.p1  ORF type:complete len:138 (-),score=37.87 TRINITY_DN10865_c0_g1_i1:8-421(-)